VTRKGGRPRGDKQAEADVERRRMLVYRHFVRAVPQAEIVKTLVKEGYSQRTLERDVQEVKVWIRQDFRAEREYLMAESLAEIQEMRQEAWAVVSAGGSTNQDRFRKLAGLDRIMRLQVMRNAILGISQALPEPSRLDQLADLLADLIIGCKDKKAQKTLMDLVRDQRILAEAGSSPQSLGVAEG